MKEYIQYAKDMAKADKELPIEHWVYISFEIKLPDGNNKHLANYDIPRKMLERWIWLIDWKRAKLKCQYPRFHIWTSYCYYDKRTGLETGFGTLLYKLSASKAQITKIENTIPEYINEQRQNNLFFDPETDEILLKAYRKLDEKKHKYTAMLALVEQEVEKHKSRERI